MFENALNQSFKFKTKDWVKINDESQGMYNEYNQVRFETSVLRSSLCDYSDAYILVKGTITVANNEASGEFANKLIKR